MKNAFYPRFSPGPAVSRRLGRLPGADRRQQRLVPTPADRAADLPGGAGFQSFTLAELNRFGQNRFCKTSGG
jgi:hypothetical protein